ncbi:head fiber protein [Bifidobacterium parmae]|uniref:Head fiber protein n=1 Tax=Bifidobacterium parmae TaxID=361854 RepID=A0A2N5IWB0_9BIFI|nr:head fiber protein [Bifidobacterium parmae]PLS26245.1 Head fiber protein [Bifidobacterium parmae]
MTFKIHAIPAADAADRIAPYDGVAEAVFVDADGNPVDLTAGSTPADGSITSDMLAAGAVNTAAIGDGQVTAAKLAKGVLPAAYTLPAATATALGGVKQGAAVPNVAADADAAALASAFNGLLTQLRAAGVIAPK